MKDLCGRCKIPGSCLFATNAFNQRNIRDEELHLRGQSAPPVDL